jgi:hypothetical protein
MLHERQCAMRRTVVVLTMGAALVAAPTASAEPQPGCRDYGQAVRRAQDSWHEVGPGAFGQRISTLAHDHGDPLFLDRLIFCAPPLPE